jgi:rhamnose utilization protein RhaD (predicted bifunctional aldolase and dehydrogenase)/NAD(P)-dependent dehydrogenase (short-subunit alcohol dehydrogenase family)
MLAKLSRFYGSDPAFVLAGGGNTSVKVGDRLFVKASGTALADVDERGFVEMDRNRLEALAEASLGDDPVKREARFKDAIYAARIRPDLGQRPSVEVLLHHLVPGQFVIHTHATTVNALTCSREGEKLASQWFGGEVLWLPYIDPGFTLAMALKKALAGWVQRSEMKAPLAILMANHGLIVAGDEPDEVRGKTQRVLETIEKHLGDNWQSRGFGAVRAVSDSKPLVNAIGPALRAALAEGESLKVVTFDDSPLAMDCAAGNEGKLTAIGGPMTPDQIVYCHSYPMWFEPEEGVDANALADKLSVAVRTHEQKTGSKPRIVLVKGVGLFAAGDDWKQADTARQVYLDAIKVMAGATRLGGVSYLSDAHRTFIEEWEVESYRRKVAAGSTERGRAAGKVAIVTGAAQGFGLEIAQQFAVAGGSVVLVDLNVDGAQAAAAKLCELHGPGRAIGLAVNVTDSESIAACVHEVVRVYGGFDVFVSNAGVLKAESVKTQPLKDFQFVTSVNYTGYFLCVQQAAPVLALQHRVKGDYLSDIIQINSKSGLVGSNRNGAYAGSKFGGIGLTQSFALELIEDGVKVNSICPGNFFDGPLWSDPNNGLFVQYLRTGKVPGAKTIEDVKKAYEAKVPMGRGCRTDDVMRAILYLIEQRYETGQAVPVTGGQVMLS